MLRIAFIAPGPQRLLKARQLKRFNQVINHAIAQRRLDGERIGSGRIMMTSIFRPSRAKRWQQVQATLLVHIDIQQQQIDLRQMA